MGRAIESMGLEGVWDLKPMFHGGEVKKILPNLPVGPIFSDVMDVSELLRVLSPERSKMVLRVTCCTKTPAGHKELLHSRLNKTYRSSCRTRFACNRYFSYTVFIFKRGVY